MAMTTSGVSKKEWGFSSSGEPIECHSQGWIGLIWPHLKLWSPVSKDDKSNRSFPVVPYTLTFFSLSARLPLFLKFSRKSRNCCYIFCWIPPLQPLVVSKNCQRKTVSFMFLLSFSQNDTPSPLRVSPLIPPFSSITPFYYPTTTTSSTTSTTTST